MKQPEAQAMEHSKESPEVKPAESMDQSPEAKTTEPMDQSSEAKTVELPKQPPTPSPQGQLVLCIFMFTTCRISYRLKIFSDFEHSPDQDKAIVVSAASSDTPVAPPLAIEGNGFVPSLGLLRFSDRRMSFFRSA